ncbi:hypothetical protein AD01_5061 [Escherichia coli 2-427-07_S4_C2]|nr:hypothetical protein CSC38_0985 [Escherichia coli]KDY20741.1 hypothetical protein AD30_1490 [Escherichia coli 2-316-03_S4_C3]KDY40221.1 hypothetical protein AD01_5061 [Escherichia coli 2-427-07_S4_C2]KEJ43118.1 hypothetical protein AB65_5732 [Escherichia coli 2-460-02_S1_C3]KEJ60440.1 hypothetical protein AC85_1690 [Escherichia coli 3-020-07_S4_C1]KEO42805.1 hypothetical protein AB34_5370 [Escherichia coli 2-460-02_S1_C2]CDK90281.1 hypothetical protein [Escherichia coli IS29]CDL03041.1 hy
MVFSEKAARFANAYGTNTTVCVILTHLYTATVETWMSC